MQVKGLHNEECLEFYCECKDEVELIGAAAIGIAPLFVQFVPLVSELDILMKTAQKSDYTRKMHLADKERDDTCRGFFTMVKGARKHPDTDKQDAAMRISIVVDGYKDTILHGAYAEASGSIHNLLQDLRGASAADLALIGLTGWVDAIGQAEQNFLAFRHERHEEASAKPLEKIRNVRVKIDSVYLAMMNTVDGILIANGLGGDIVLGPDIPDSPGEENPGGSGPVEESIPVTRTGSGNAAYDFVVRWNEIVKRYRDLLHQRAGRREKAKNEAEEDNDDPELIED